MQATDTDPTPAATVGQQVVVTVDQAGYDDQAVGMEGVLTAIDTVSLKGNLTLGDRDGAYQVRLPDGEHVWVADVRPVGDKAAEERLELVRLRRMRARLAAFAEQGVMPDDVRRQLRDCVNS